MSLLVFLSSGLFLGWTLGANDAANIFGSAVGSRMVTFKRAAIISSIFVILGAVLQGNGTTETLGKLGEINALAGSFTVALAAGLTVYAMTRQQLPVSTSQAIVGAIIGWNLYSGFDTDFKILAKIITAWISSPILGALFAIILYWLVKHLIRISKIHLLKLDGFIRWGLILVGAFGAYSLGANNIANVMGVFVNAFPEINAEFLSFSFSTTQILFFLGALAISIGIFTYSRKIMETVGNEIVSLTPESAIVVVLAQAMVLFLFSSSSLSALFQKIGLPGIPLVPVSSSQVIVGAVIGIGLMKSIHEIRIRIVGEIALGWLLTPIISGVITYFSLFFVENVFNQPVFLERSFQKNRIIKEIPPISEPFNFKIIIYIFILLSVVLVSFACYKLIIYILKRKKVNSNTIMGKEIERKFLVKETFRKYVTAEQRITQGYLSSHPERNVRVRVKGQKGFITVKGISNESGMSRFEWEKEIPLAEAEELLQLCEPTAIIKIRNIVEFAGKIFEVDEFFGENEGLILAEIELESEDEEFDKPVWLDQEVTGDIRYYNSYLSEHPFKEWRDKSI